MNLLVKQEVLLTSWTADAARGILTISYPLRTAPTNKRQFCGGDFLVYEPGNFRIESAHGGSQDQPEWREQRTVTRLYFLRLRRLTKNSLGKGYVTPELERARAEHIPTFTHFLDIPILLVIISLGALRPNNWTLLFVGTLVALVLATILTLVLPRLYPWTPADKTDGTRNDQGV